MNVYNQKVLEDYAIHVIVTYQLDHNNFISFEAWDKLAQKWLVYAPLGIHLEPINEDLRPLVTI